MSEPKDLQVIEALRDTDDDLPIRRTTMTTDNLNLAREWARDNIHGWHFIGSDRALAAAEVIIALPDTIVDGDRLREAVADHHLDMSDELMEALGALLPTPALPTLADMAPEERAECEWMQCDHPGLEEPGVILQIWGVGCHVLSREGVVETEALKHVVPRPDLPRMEWPGNEPEDDVAYATGGELTTQDVVDECRAVRKERATPKPATPRPEDVPVGEAWQVEVNGQGAIGYRNDPESRICWAVVRQDATGHHWVYDSEVTLIARLVPETTEQDDEPDFDPAYTYRDCDGDEWEYIEGRWITGDTHAERVAAREDGRGRASLPVRYGPYTRIEKEEDNE